MQLINVEQVWGLLIAVCAAIAACVAGGDAREKRGPAQRLV
jgi:hypothetical protein